ncbi:MAG TPA: hypothetical protein VGQ46_17270 [Thermoanaerobaculia bacterium]|jgi:hypothetical protein|nr:hypothetical protein [Thermoanaerobaculia bacterium]
MANVDGQWETVIKSPMGDQSGTLTVDAEGGSFKGSYASATGTTAITGEVADETLTWKMKITVPMPMTLDCKATVTGNTMTGTVTAGAFGTFPLTGTRA